VPDVRDGLTAACRRALCALYEERARTTKYVKSARIVDLAAGRSRASGDAAGIYRELVRMAREFEVRYPLVDGQGNFGSIDDDPAAEMEYTEMRMAPIAGALLPARFPNLLVNGSFGVETDGASSIAPHNLREIIDATIAYIDDPAIDVDGLMNHIAGPDFPTGGIIIGRDALREAYATGRGDVVVRGSAHTERADPGYVNHYVSSGRMALADDDAASDDGPASEQAIVITELPFMLTKGGDNGLQADIVEAIQRKHITGIADLVDHSSEHDGIRLVIELHAAASPDAVLGELYEHTRLQTTFELNSVALVDGAVRTLSLHDAIGLYVGHHTDVVARCSADHSPDRVKEIVKDELHDIAERHGDRRRTKII